MVNPSDLFQEWRVADRQAHALERAIIRSALDALEGSGDGPTDAESDAARRKRGIANDLFQVAMDEMAQRARLNRR